MQKNIIHSLKTLFHEFIVSCFNGKELAVHFRVTTQNEIQTQRKNNLQNNCVKKFMARKTN